MKKPILGMAIMLGAACVVCGQQGSNAPPTGRTAENAAAAFSDTSAAQVNLFETDTSESRSFAFATPSTPEAAPLPAAPAPKPKFVFGDRDDYRWQLGLGVEFMRFQSNIINASLVGTNTSVTYYTNSWFALEGDIVTGFAPQIYDREHVKLFGGAGGVKIGGRRARWEPWGHALVGGSHLQPQTAGASRSALMAQAGAGVDYRVHSRLSLRVEADWVYTSFFGQAQNNYQA